MTCKSGDLPRIGGWEARHLKIMLVKPFGYFLLFVLGLRGAHAASLEGTVTDPQSKAVPGAAILLTSATSALRWTAFSNASGAWHLDNLPVGDYLLRVDANGFATFLLDPFHLDSGAAKTEDITLRLAGSREEIVVTASSTPQT